MKGQVADFTRPLTTVDIVVFRLKGEALEALLVRRPRGAGEPFPGRWALPGGFIDVERDDDLESCARRKLTEKTGVAAPYLEQLGSFGSRSRDPRGWSATHVYFALLADGGPEPQAGGNAAETRWFRISGDGVGETLAFDHGDLLAAALARLRSKVEYTSLPVFLLPGEFTLPELQRTYEIVLGRSLEKKAFRTRILAADLLEAVPRMQAGGNRPAQLYRLRPRQGAHIFARPFGSAEPPG